MGRMQPAALSQPDQLACMPAPTQTFLLLTRARCAGRYHVHRAALAALLAVGAVLAMDATNAFFLGWLLCAPWRTICLKFFVGTGHLLCHGPDIHIHIA